MRRLGAGLAALAMAAGMAGAPCAARGATFGEDLEFLQKHVEVVVLSDKAGDARVAVVPALQGRVMTSTAGGAGGPSFGWINRELFASGKRLEHFNPFGGEDRFWLGPEGGQFSVYHVKGGPFDLEHWYVPPSLDTEPFDVLTKAQDGVVTQRQFEVTNYSGTKFQVKVDREVRLLAAADAWKRLGVAPVEGVRMVAYESANRITNAGREPWKKETGLLSVWILGMFAPSPRTTVVVPIRPGPESEFGKTVVDDYFGKVPAERLAVKDKTVYFRADGACRSKIGFGPKRATGILGSYDAAGKVLTLVQHTFPEGQSDYVNSQWKLQDNPYAGEVANSYNDGPASPGAKPAGPFYELESSSPAAALEPGKGLEHVHRTVHLLGTQEQLDGVARAALGVGIDEIVKVFGK